MQTKWQSFVEAKTNLAVAFGIGWLANVYLAPYFGVPMSASQGFKVTLMFSVISLIRQYTLRRLFNRIHRHSVETLVSRNGKTEVHIDVFDAQLPEPNGGHVTIPDPWLQKHTVKPKPSIIQFDSELAPVITEEQMSWIADGAIEGIRKGFSLEDALLYVHTPSTEGTVYIYQLMTARQRVTSQSLVKKRMYSDSQNILGR